MRDRKLYDLLRRLSPEERALFVEFLRSPLHAHRPKLGDMVALMEELLFAAPDRPCSSEDFYAAFYPGKPYDSNNLNRLISVITTEFKEFLALRFFQRDRTARTACATREMSRRRWEDILPKEIALTRKALQEELPDDEHNYYQLYCLEYENARHYMENAARKGETIYQPMIDAADRFSILLKSKLISIVHIYDEKFKTRHQIRWQDILADPAIENFVRGTVTTRLFIQAKKLLISSSTKESFESFAQTLENELPHFDRENLPQNLGLVNKVDSELLYMLGDNAAFQILKDDRDFMIRAQLKNVKIGIDKGILLEEGFLNPRSYQNYIRTAALIGRMDEAWDFLYKNAPLLREKEQQVAPDLSAALLHLMENQSNKALSILLKLKSKLTQHASIINHLEARVMLCIAWYKLKDMDSLTHESNAMRTYVDRANPSEKAATAPYRAFLKAIMTIEKAESRITDKRMERYKKILWNFKYGPNFTGKGLLRKEIIQRYGPEIEDWHQAEPGAN